MKPILFPFFNDIKSATMVATHCHYEVGEITIRSFPDGETYINFPSVPKNRDILFYASLNHPNTKILPLLLAAATAKTLGAKTVGLIAPYLAYMRQDKQFNPGEGFTAQYFAKLLSSYFDWLITVDPHLHRYHSLSEIYSISTQVIHATEAIAQWINQHVTRPLLIGPDQESEQWVAEIAKKIHSPFVVLEKTRKGDRTVSVSFPAMTQYNEHTPILVDDIISTGRTMIETVTHLQQSGPPNPICIGVHGIFAEQAYEKLLNAGAHQVITCNTIPHISNAIDLTSTIAATLRSSPWRLHS